MSPAVDSQAVTGAVLTHHGLVIPPNLVDALPERLWKPGNFYIPAVGDRLIGHWHFCTGHDDDGRNVRTIERNHRVIGRGRKDFDFAAHQDG
jgi:hypothetical protein